MAGIISRGDVRLYRFESPDKTHLCAVNLQNAVTIPLNRLGRRLA